ncbi:DNA-binding transcription factor yap1, partial [Rhizoclosmatium hyalinum]
PGRKLDTSTPTDKRVAQSREAQRAFRERKANHVKELESKVAELTALVEGKGPSKTELELQQKVEALTAENSLLRQMTFSFDFSHPLAALGMPPVVTGGLANLFASPPVISNPSPSASLTSDDAFTALLMQSIPGMPAIPTTASPASSTSTPPSFASVTSNQLVQSPAVSVKTADPLDFTSLIDFTSFRDNTSASQKPINGLDDNEPDFLESLLRTNSTPPPAKTATPSPSETTSALPEHEELCEQALKEMPYLGEAYDTMKAIPSLKDSDNLIEELCDVFVECSTKCIYETLKTGVCPGENPTPGSVYEHMANVKSKVLSKCTPEDGEKVIKVMNYTKEKHTEFLLSKQVVSP